MQCAPQYNGQLNWSERCPFYGGSKVGQPVLSTRAKSQDFPVRNYKFDGLHLLKIATAADMRKCLDPWLELMKYQSVYSHQTVE